MKVIKLKMMIIKKKKMAKKTMKIKIIMVVNKRQKKSCLMCFEDWILKSFLEKQKF